MDSMRCAEVWIAKRKLVEVMSRIRTQPDNCPHCGVSLRGEPLPAETIAAQTLQSMDEYGLATHVRREIGRSGLHPVYDGVLFWECPDCGGKWHRFTVASREHHWAKMHMTATIPDTTTGEGPR